MQLPSNRHQCLLDDCSLRSHCSTICDVVMFSLVHWSWPCHRLQSRLAPVLMLQNHKPQLTLTATTQTCLSYTRDRTKTMCCNNISVRPSVVTNHCVVVFKQKMASRQWLVLLTRILRARSHRDFYRLVQVLSHLSATIRYLENSRLMTLAE